ncbi:MAG: helix-turn-helix domain-containing protein [Solirubrobacteraceae bacterium]
MAEIGATLREARMRARIDVSEIEAQTKIRAKYLRALENEEWDLLPGPTFVKSFLRTYAQALGLDGRAVVEEYKLHYEHPGEGAEPAPQPPASAQRWTRRHAADRRSPSAAPRRRGSTGAPPRQGPSRAYIATVSVVGVVIVLLVYALLSGGGSTQSPTTGTPAANSPRKAAGRNHATHNGSATVTATATLASLKVEPSAEVYVCLIGDGRKRIPGLILTPESTLPTYHAQRFELTLGNNAVALVVNGAPHTVPASAQAIGYEITRAGMKALAASEQPTCK